MARLSRKAIVVDFGTDEKTLEQIQAIKKKVKISMVMKMTGSGKLEIEVRGSKVDVQEAMGRIKRILQGETT